MDNRQAGPVNPALAFARSHVGRPAAYRFTEHEEEALELFFSNTTRNLFLIENLPSNVRASLLAMYSRMKNDRGLRGVFVDMLLPSFLVTLSPPAREEMEREKLSIADYLRKYRIQRLDDLFVQIPDMLTVFDMFCASVTGDPEYIREFANSERIRTFLAMWLDAYGHNSIARNGEVVICFEQVSVLAAKAIEHVRPGAGFIELSTRYVDMTQASWYPIAAELSEASLVPDCIEVNGLLRRCADVYLEQTAAYTSYLEGIYPDAQPGGVFGEVCDVMANALPAGVNTSVGCVVSGEALRSLIKCLMLEGLAETTALAEALVKELEGAGTSQFARHIEPTPFEMRLTGYLRCDPFLGSTSQLGCGNLADWDVRAAEDALWDSFALSGIQGDTVGQMIDEIMGMDRGEHDKLPPMFEDATVRFAYKTTFRTWREIQRHVMARHERTLLTPYLGFFSHDKPISAELVKAFTGIAGQARRVHAEILAANKGVPRILDMLQYLLPMGYNVGATLTTNVRNAEFLTWQRSGHNVNHEARQVALYMDQVLSSKFAWWHRASRTDRTPAYRLAREKYGVPIELSAAA